MSAGPWFLLLVPATLALSVGLTLWLASARRRGRALLDQPNDRSLHRHPVPRDGGLAIVLSLLATLWPLWLWGEILGGAGAAIPTALVLAWLPVALVAWLDDRHGLPNAPRLLVQVGAAFLLWWAGLGIAVLEWPGLMLSLPSWASLPLTLGFVVWMINLYNFMDGMDGLAAVMAISGFAALAGLGALGGDWTFALVAAAVVAAAAGFLVGNFPPARIFMGDLGAYSLGFLAAGLALWGQERGLFPLWVAVLAFSPFIVDATWTLLARLLRREPFWKPHRSHHYQRLVLAGWSHRRTLTRAALVMAACALCALAAPGLAARDQVWLLMAWGAIYPLIHLKVRLVERAAREPA